MDIDRIISSERVRLACLPTPLETTEFGWGPRRLLVKRDDLTGATLSGNKVRKLEYLLADARAQGCDTVITCGGIQSNHARATAIAARQLGLGCTLVLTGTEPEQLDGNLLLSRLAGADVRVFQHVSIEDRALRMEALAEQIRSAGGKPYVIPGGGSNEIGALGYVRAAQELVVDLRARNAPVGCVVVAVGSGGTYAGLFLGLRLSGASMRVVGATVDGTPESWRPALAEYMRRCNRRWGTNVRLDEGEIELLGAVGRGYAQSDPAEIAFIAEIAKRTGLLLDPVYTGKALYTLDHEIRTGRFDPGGDVVFVHTGGVFGLFPKRKMLAEALDGL